MMLFKYLIGRSSVSSEIRLFVFIMLKGFFLISDVISLPPLSPNEKLVYLKEDFSHTYICLHQNILECQIHSLLGTKTFFC
jgi:hypothetical protein